MKEKRNVLIQVKVTETEKKEIQKRASKIGLDISNYVRLSCLKEVNKWKEVGKILD